LTGPTAYGVGMLIRRTGSGWSDISGQRIRRAGPPPPCQSG
jgi:hypothetical protein